MSSKAPDALLDCLSVAAGGYQPEVLDRLWQAVPAEWQLERFAADTLAEQQRGSFVRRLERMPALQLSGLPEPMRRELAWCVFRMAGQGGVICTNGMSMLVLRLGEVVTDMGPGRAPCSVAEWPVRQWQQQIALAVRRRTGALPAPRTIATVRQHLASCQRLLFAAYDCRPWWQHEVWDPVADPRIPQRAHEPLGRSAVYFHHISIGWLRRAVQWHCKVSLETATLTWSSVHMRARALSAFDAFLVSNDIDKPWLADEPGQVRALLLDYLGHVRGLRVTRPGPTLGQRLSAAHVGALLGSAEQFYLFMHDHKDAAARALSEPAWLALGPQHAGFFRRGEIARPSARPEDRDVIDDDAFSKIMAGIGLLGDPAADGGMNDEQAMRILMLLARTGRRLSEILMLDRDPLLPLGPAQGPGGEPEPGAFIAKLRYQQTKIEGAPDTILIDEEIAAIIRAQQQWADEFLAQYGPPLRPPKYLFLAARKNRHGDRPYCPGQLHHLLSELARRLDIRDTTGRLVDFQRTHRFRHTRATSLLNAGVPLPVVQRYLGHLSPTMTMRYAQTLAITHEREFLRYRKITADARELDTDPRDLYDMLELDKRTDRVLPNGWCLLPPRQVCTKGNACLTCDKFATDATFLPELTAQRERTGQLITERQQAFKIRTGQEMSDTNVWLAGRRQEQDALGRIIVKLEQTRLADGTVRAVRGAGVTARTDALALRRDDQDRADAR
jgi:integrase